MTQHRQRSKTDSGGRGPDRILFVCTANECRSPFAEGYARMIAGDAAIEFRSAGIAATGRGVPAEGRRLAAECGFDLSGHVARRVDAAALTQQDLILALSREHARELLVLVPAVRARLFTVKQFARWIRDHARPGDAPLGPWLDATAADRPAALLLGADRADDVADPVGRPLSYWRRVADDLIPALDAVVYGVTTARPSRRS